VSISDFSERRDEINSTLIIVSVAIE
jgi:hypothetical protein